MKGEIKMFEKISMCNSCPDCVGCGRKNQIRTVCYCDSCGDLISRDSREKHGFLYQGSTLCEDCVVDAIFFNDNGEIIPEAMNDCLKGLNLAISDNVGYPLIDLAIDAGLIEDLPDYED